MLADRAYACSILFASEIYLGRVVNTNVLTMKWPVAKKLTRQLSVHVQMVLSQSDRNSTGEIQVKLEALFCYRRPISRDWSWEAPACGPGYKEVRGVQWPISPWDDDLSI